jgi:hypothetical protein
MRLAIKKAGKIITKIRPMATIKVNSIDHATVSNKLIRGWPIKSIPITPLLMSFKGE